MEKERFPQMCLQENKKMEKEISHLVQTWTLDADRDGEVETRDTSAGQRPHVATITKTKGMKKDSIDLVHIQP